MTTLSPRPIPDDLLAVANEAHTAAYCPYSQYRVGAALRTVSGSVIAGCNVENAAYPLGSCAESGAIAAMVLAGDHEIVEVVGVTDGDEPGTPCGGCRQRLREFAGPDVVVHSVSATTGAARSLTVAELLPDSFGPERLKRPVR